MSGGWLPMVSAPKDGTPVEVAWLNRRTDKVAGTGQCAWDSETGCWMDVLEHESVAVLPHVWRPLGGES